MKSIKLIITMLLFMMMSKVTNAQSYRSRVNYLMQILRSEYGIQGRLENDIYDAKIKMEKDWSILKKRRKGESLAKDVYNWEKSKIEAAYFKRLAELLTMSEDEAKLLDRQIMKEFKEMNNY